MPGERREGHERSWGPGVTGARRGGGARVKLAARHRGRPVWLCGVGWGASLPELRRRLALTGYSAPAVKASAGGGREEGVEVRGRRAGTGAPRCRGNKNASPGTAHGEAGDGDAAARGGGKSGGGRPGGGGGGGGREVKGLAKFSGCCGRRAPG
ncbi:unnamed protein product [Rangifer tarandus platyrhynchus]|uniref:Uncharacterized protein n=1 Tax=Rangifer tarandus platyrhynchus TaxID=3082113 RepID=A0ABN8YXW3_RANTA|nr:unnamed protein product [Rangifer tarandus platyrhynchus]